MGTWRIGVEVSCCVSFGQVTLCINTHCKHEYSVLNSVWPEKKGTWWVLEKQSSVLFLEGAMKLYLGTPLVMPHIVSL